MKRRRVFKVYRQQTEVAHGILYDEGNVQVLWRKDIGYTAEQYANISQVFGILPGAYTIEVENEKEI